MLKSQIILKLNIPMNCASASFAPCIIHLHFLLSKRSKYKKENPTNLIRKEIVITSDLREKNQVVEQDLLYGSPVSSKLCIELL